ncbi:MAG: hypothetical protein HY271_11940 [Deltaproteobacteria bacterium]|nr:hypothetical protein [Deltaproteobacteria bacterium]
MTFPHKAVCAILTIVLPAGVLGASSPDVVVAAEAKRPPHHSRTDASRTGAASKESEAARQERERRQDLERRVERLEQLYELKEPVMPPGSSPRSQ